VVKQLGVIEPASVVKLTDVPSGTGLLKVSARRAIRSTVWPLILSASGFKLLAESVKRFNEKGIHGLIEKPRSGRPRALSTEQLQKLKEYVVSHAIKPDGGRLKGTLVIAYTKQ
jgi:hypothetical protein